MSRAAVIVGAALAGALLGGGLMVAIQAADRPATDAAPRRTSVEQRAATLAPPSTRPLPSTTGTAPEATPSVLLAWSRSGAGRGLDPGLEPAAVGFPGVGATSLVRAGGPTGRKKELVGTAKGSVMRVWMQNVSVLANSSVAFYEPWIRLNETAVPVIVPS